jgi:hypothetical protein
VSSARHHISARCLSTRSLLSALLFLLVCSTPAFTLEVPPKSFAPPKYDLQTGTKAKAVVVEVSVFDFGTRKDFIELILRMGNETVVVYVCPKPFQEEMGISFTRGDQISFTGSRVQQEGVLCDSG